MNWLYAGIVFGVALAVLFIIGVLRQSVAVENERDEHDRDADGVPFRD
jgi:MFS superfamily sulfate permease-like transporter